jgi:putative DNA primase/helicase
MGEQLRRNEARIANGEKPESAPPVGKMLCANIDLALRTRVSVAAKGWHDKRPGRFIAFADRILDLGQWIAGDVAYVDQTPEYFDPNALNYALEYTDAEPSVFLSMLREQFSPKEIAAFQEFGGYCFTDENDIQRMLGIFGPPRSGKGTMERTLQASIGRHNTVAKSFDSFVSAHALEDVVGKTLLVLSDTRPDPKVSRAGVERLLGISGQDTMNINPKNRKHFDADLICKILIMANLLPDFSDASGALLARFMFLQTTKSFVGQEDSELLSKILREQNAIAWWFLRGLRRLLTNGRYTEPDNQLREKFEAKNNPVPTFVGMQCEVTGKSDDKLQPGDLFNAFEEWAIPFEVAPMTENVFFRELYRYFPTVSRTHGYIRGITLKDSEPMDGQLLDAHLMANAA